MLIGISGHSMADTLSVSDSRNSYSDRDTHEIAFFKDGKMIADIVPRFAEWTMGDGNDPPMSVVYGYVPRHEVSLFLVDYTTAVHDDMLKTCEICGNRDSTSALRLCGECYNNHKNGLCETPASRCEACRMIERIPYEVFRTKGERVTEWVTE